MLTLKKNAKPDLEISRVKCDGGLHPKLDNYEILSHMNRHDFCIVTGAPGSGKSSLIQSFYKSPKVFKKVFHQIILFAPASSRGSMVNDAFSKLPDNQVFHELTSETLAAAKEFLNDEDNTVFIFDDMAAGLRDSEIQRQLKELAFNRRHLHLSIQILTQSHMCVPPQLRRVCNNYICFKTSKQELEIIFRELVECRSGLEDTISKFCYDKKHQFIFFNVPTQQMYKGWDRIIFPNDDIQNDSDSE